MDPYAPLAAAYGTLTDHHDYDRWLTVIEDEARGAGLAGTRVLDVACGSGSSFLPLLGRYEVTACDVSAAMLDQARRRLNGRPVRLIEHDMRELPELGEFDLVLCLDDALNHLLEPHEVRDALAGIARNLAPDGVAVFDVNTLATLRAVFSSDHVKEDPQHLVLWRGEGRSDLPVGGRTSAKVDVFAKSDDRYLRHTATLAERHHPVADVAAMLSAVGLEAWRCLGQSNGVRMAAEVDELGHAKALFVARRRYSGPS
ncbi:MAG TPA: class I SAM-dependent methyltransferase [Solirubrobacteraceae bacterium]|nr:class I SAM-dependent methyltransferase [Solirubrobacteraceae bacterium]